MPTSWRFAVGVGMSILLVSVQAWSGEPAAGGSKPKFSPAQLAAIDTLCEHGGIAIGLDEDRPGTPVVSIDFAAHPDFRDDWLKHLRVFPELAVVRLSGTGVSDAGIEHLLELPQLSELSLDRSQVTDAGLAKLARLKQLKQLDLSGTQVSAEAVAELRKALPQLKIVAQAKQPASMEQAGPSQTEPAPQAGVPLPSGGDTVKRFTAKQIKQWRERAAEISALPEGTPEGWSKSRVDPKKVLDLFPKLRLRKGYVLRAYVYRSDGNSNGFVWALPVDAEYPAPADCPRLESHFLKPPKPFDALDDVMEAIEGDDVPEAYLQASIFRREIREFGAGWHGVRWGFYTVIDANPWQGGAADGDDSPLSRPQSKPQQWKWVGTKPTQWSPEVRFERDRAVVTFYSYTPLVGHLDDNKIEKERIIFHTDTYRRGKFRPLVVEKKIAEGPDAISP